MARDNPSATNPDVLNHRFDLVERGLAFWCKNDLDAYSRVLILPDGNGSLASIAMGLLADMQTLPAKDLKPIAIVAAAPISCIPGIVWITASKDEMDCIITLYSMYEFTDKLVFVSFDKPYGRKLHNLFETGIAGEKELTADVILGVLHAKDA